jgi:hypothetical protein
MVPDNAEQKLRRIAPRYVFEARIRLRLQRGPQTLVVGGWARDLSESGLAAFVAESLQLGEHVTLEIPLTGTHPTSVPAVVVRSLGTQYGFAFTALSLQQRQIIQEAFAGKQSIQGP